MLVDTLFECRSNPMRYCQTTLFSQVVSFVIVSGIMFDGGFDVDWNKAKCDNETRVNKVIEGKISLFTLKRYLICVNKSCAKKVTPLPGDRLVKCFSCSGKMKISACKLSSSANVLVEDKSGEQHDLTIFQSVINDVFENKIPDQDEDVEEYFLNLEKVSMEVNFKNIIVSLNI